MVDTKMLIYGLFSLYCLIFSSCGEFRLKQHTPKEFINNVIVTRALYVKDSTQIQDTLINYLKEHRHSFYSKEYFDLTQIIIDTIIHNDSCNKFIVFVITKNPTYRQRNPINESNWYYDATSYIGIRNKENIHLAWIGPNFSNAKDQSELSSTIRSAYFTEFATSDTIGGGMYKYNMNDSRFWGAPIWRKVGDIGGGGH
ncbi:hypothetical protein [Chitinophaga lutea]|uniref:hypothetical protein n=1 Tax=Chitinophaga lutea TaxID=2488634 RepID=UPI000F502895|nr:hypothetical protein [Chitinophaga lutea]